MKYYARISHYAISVFLFVWNNPIALGNVHIEEEDIQTVMGGMEDEDNRLITNQKLHTIMAGL